MEKLVQLRIMKESLNNQGSKVYGLVDMIHIHIQYDEDDSIEDELNKLFLEGNAAIEAKQIKKSKRKHASNGGQKGSQPKQLTNKYTEDTEDTDEDNSEINEVEHNHADSDNFELEEVQYNQVFK